MMGELIDGRYRIESQVGRGGMGVVYKAYDRLIRQHVALKQVTLDSVMGSSEDTGSMRMRLISEFQIMAGLRHPYVLEVYDYGFYGEPYFTMRLLENSTLLLDYAKTLDNVEEKIKLLINLLEALQYLHRRNIIHRDLKPNNILIDADNQLKLLDFGLAVRDHRPAEVAGTVAYMAPEVMAAEAVTTIADQFSVGIIAYEILTGVHPFKAENMMAMLTKVLQSEPDWSLLDAFEPVKHVIHRLLEKSPQFRYPSAADAIAAFALAYQIPSQAESIAIRDSYLKTARFVGRDDEMEVLSDALQDAIDGRGSAWLVGGENGIGKTRLLDELRVHALVNGALVFRGHAMEGGGLPLQIWREILRRLALVGQLSEQESGIFKEVIPEIDYLLEQYIPVAPQLPAEDSKQRLAATITDVLRRQKRPILILLEDMHWAMDGIDLLKRLHSMLPIIPVMIVASYRTDDAPEFPKFVPDVNHMLLDRLSEKAVTQLSVSMLGERGRNPDLVKLLHRETEGNTFFIVEVMRALAEEAGGLSAIDAELLPSEVVAGGVEDILHKRLERVDPRYRGLLRVAAISGRSIDIEVIRELATKYGVDVEQWLTNCSNAAVLEMRDDMWRFTHDRLRKQLIADIPPMDMVVFHQQVAEAIEWIHLGNMNYATVLTDHWHIAGNYQKERYYAATAAAQMLAVGNYVEARRLFKRGLDLTPQEEVSQRANLLVTLATICSQVSDFAEAQDYAEQALEFARESGRIDTAIQAYVIQATVAEQQSEYQHGVDLLEQALEHFSAYNRPSLQVQVLNALATVLIRNNSIELAEDYLNQARDLLTTIDDRLLTADHMLAYGILEKRRNNMQAAEEYCYQALMAFESVGNYSQVARTRSELGRIAFKEERYAVAAAHLELALRNYRDLGDQLGTADCMTKLGNVYLKLGEPMTARTYFDDALVIATRLNTPALMLDAMMGGAQVMVADINAQEDVAPVNTGMEHPTGARSTQQIIQKILMQVRDRVSPEVYQSMVDQGSKLNLKQIVELIDKQSKSDKS